MIFNIFFLLVGIEFNFACDPLAASRVLEEFQTTIRIVTFELTCMSTISFEELDTEYLPLTQNPNNKKARLFFDVSKFFIDFLKAFENNPELYTGLNSCDAVCMACVLDESFITETKRIYAFVEPFGQITAGHMVSDWYNHFKREPNVEIISNVDKEKFQKLFRLCIQE